MKLESNDELLSQELTKSWTREEEWYMFYDNPRNNGCEILYTVDENGINPSGNIKFLASDKDWGMGADHPIVWYHDVGKGRAFYSAIGHKGSSFQEQNHLKMLENAIRYVSLFDN